MVDPVPSNNPLSVIDDQIRQLGKLKDDGLVTEDEFATKKQANLKLLGWDTRNPARNPSG